MSIWRWADLIKAPDPSARITLGEAATPLLRSRRLGPSAGLPNLFFKLETTNPTGSFKDRFAAAAISTMLAGGQTHCVGTSSGNTGAALAAYCAAAGIECRIAVVETAPAGKLKQMQAYGARIARVKRFGIDAATTTRTFDLLKQIGQRAEWSLQISAFVYSAEGMAGVQSIAYELAEQSERPIDHVFCPAGGGGLCVAVARGFTQLVQIGQISRCPAVQCVQPAGNNTISGPLGDGAEHAQAVQCTSKISGLQVASVVDGDLAIQSCRPTGGTGHLVNDEQVWEIQRRLAREEGVFTEPAGAIATAAALNAVGQGLVRRDATVVCLVTGSGFKDEASINQMVSDVECPLLDCEDLLSW